MTASALGARPSSAAPGGASEMTPGSARPLVVTGTIAACAAAGTGMVILTLLVLAGWIAAPHAAIGLTGLTGVLRVAAALWLVGHHVGFTLHGAGRIGLLPLGLVLLPGALLWRAGRWVVRTGTVSRLRHVGYAALALAVPYALVASALALASRSALAEPSLPQAAIASFLLALTAGGLGGARALAPWAQLAGLMPARLRSVIAGTVGSLAVLVSAGAVLAGASLGAHLGEFSSVNSLLAPGAVGAGLLLLAQLAYVPNAVVWAISFTLGPGFAVGTGTIVAPTGSAIGPLPAFPMLASLPQGLDTGAPPWLSVAVLALPFLAGALGGLLLTRAAPTPVLEAAPMWGFACGVLTGCVLGVLAAFAGGPLGDGRLAAVGPSPWQVGAVAALEVGVAAAVAAGAANWLRLRASPSRPAPSRTEPSRPEQGWADAAGAAHASRRGGTDGPVPGRGGTDGPVPGRSGTDGPVPGRGGTDGTLPGRAVGPVPGRAVGGQADDEDSGHVIYLDPWAGEQSSAGPPSRSRGPSALP